MLRVLIILVCLGLASFVLVISIFRTAAPKYLYYQPVSPTSESTFEANIDYKLPETGIGPGNPLWPIKAVRDRVWTWVTFNPTKKSQLLLLFADKRIALADQLIGKGEIELGISTAAKAEQYLLEAQKYEEVAYGEKMETAELAQNLALSSLKHREILENSIKKVPEDARPLLSKITDVAKEVYEKSVQRLREKGKFVPTPTQTDSSN